ncbi:MAG: ABC transporter ATP-binding protein/permease [Lachnospiraceae bacterium]|nr:ABC transporter ATP-binding protein/permease [Lachnospiraceae bacterium]
MLQITDVSKRYVTGDLVQQALDHVSLTLRDNEFVAILGPSGSGKTTLLNVIGGLDRYDSGDLIINGTSTKKYNDKDWDSYRNHTIGFVFQSYNLIPHQDVISNVEMALTISGISGKEKRERAVKALEQVGLGEQLHKRPNQMSGGQMQRVAIARALVNDPDILLADEPTGALDSETSVQVMDLLKEVAKDRLVVMVTHNPELAEEYATRIVRVKDGRIIGDSDPYNPESELIPPAEHRNLGKASMSFLTALNLSFNNLKTKKARTILTAFAGSIGIIGIALIMSLSNGANNYINSIQTETLSEYPLQIDRSGMDLSSMMSEGTTRTEQDEEDTGTVKEFRTLDAILSKTSENDLKSLKEYIENDASKIKEYSTAIDYQYNVTPLIYREIGEDDYRQINPDVTFSSGTGISSGSYTSASSMAMMFTSMGSNIFSELPGDSSMYESQYEVMAGRWPSDYTECVVVLTSSGRISDLALYAIGLKDSYELDDLLKDYAETGSMTLEGDPEEFAYEDFLDISFRLVDPSSKYTYDKEYDIYVDNSDDKEFMLENIRNGETMKIVGVVKPYEDMTASMLTSGIAYSSDLTSHVMELAEESEIVAAQKADPERNVFTGKEFGDDDSSFDMESLFSFDEDSLSETLDFSSMLEDADMSELFGDLDLSDALSDVDLASAFGEMDLSSLMSSLDFSDLSKSMDLSGLSGDMDLSEALKDMDFSSLMQDLDLSEALKGIDLESLASEIDLAALLEGVDLEAALANVDVSIIFNSIDLSNIEVHVNRDALTDMFNSLLDGYLATLAEEEEPTAAGFASYVSGAEAQSIIQSGVTGFLDLDSIRSQISSQIQSGLTAALQEALAPAAETVGRQIMTNLAKQLEPAMEEIMTRIGTEIQKQLADSMDSVMTAVMGAVSEQLQTQLTSAMTEVLGSVVNQIGTNLSSSISSAMSGMMETMSVQIGNAISESMGSAMTAMMEQLSGSLSEGLGESMENAFSFNMDGDQLTSMMSSMLGSQASTYSDVLASLNSADESDPDSILIYPKDFDNKEKIVSVLDEYNQQMQDSGQEEKVIVYTDYVATMMSSVTTIINAVSYILMAFVAISLIVSSIMIGIITYISVLERTKEIGILRALGASKKNVSQVFNAETFIIGGLSGLLGIGISLILLFPINAIIRRVTDTSAIHASLPVSSAVILILLSIGLTMIGGLIPSGKASKMDPVTALRTE